MIALLSSLIRQHHGTSIEARCSKAWLTPLQIDTPCYELVVFMQLSLRLKLNNRTPSPVPESGQSRPDTISIGTHRSATRMAV